MDSRDFPFRLRTCVWEITLACCFRCAYCGSRGGKARDNELSTAECLDVARQLADMGCRRVSVIGGEVFMRPDWAEIVRALTSRGVKVCVITNGFKMTPQIISELKRIKVESVAVSLDGTREVHDAYRRAGGRDRALSAVRTLSAANISPMGNAGDNGVSVAFDAERVIRFVAETAPKAPFAVGVADNIGYYTPEEGRVRGREGAYFTGCSAGLTAVGIDSVGNVRGCESMYDERFIEGNLRERSLIDIWTDPGAFAYNRRFTKEMLSGGCKKCPHGDICAGGCRSYNFFTTGRLYENCLCARNKA